MHCGEAQIHLMDALKPAEESSLPAELETHLEQCPACRDLVRLWEHLGEPPLPEAGLPARFRARLRQERLKPPSVLQGWALPLAAAVLLLVGGAFLAGLAWQRQPAHRTPQQAILHQLRDAPAGNRLQAIALASSGRDNDPEMATALLERVMTDSRTDVRLAAVEALYLFGSDPRLGRSLTEALPRQDRPEVQLAMVDLLVALRERRAAEALRRLLQDGRLAPETRQRAEARLAEQRL